MSDSGGYIGSDRDSFYGLTPRQYHAQLDQLWDLLPHDAKGPPYSVTVFDRLEAHVTNLSAENSRLSAEVERMRGVLVGIEVGGMATPRYICPSCGADGKSTGIIHRWTCPLGRALGRPECGQ